MFTIISTRPHILIINYLNLPTMFTCWHMSLKAETHNQNDWSVMNGIEYSALRQDVHLKFICKLLKDQTKPNLISNLHCHRCWLIYQRCVKCQQQIVDCLSCWEREGNEKGTKKLKWKRMSPTRLEPTHCTSRQVIQRSRPLGHDGLTWIYVLHDNRIHIQKSITC